MSVRQAFFFGGSSTISFVGAASADANSISIPTHEGGDIIFILAKNDSTNPTIPDGWAEIETGGAAKFAYKVASDGTTVSDTWTDAQVMAVAVYRGVRAIGDTAYVSDTGNFNYPALTLTNDKSWVVGALGEKVSRISAEIPPTGMTNRIAEDDGSDDFIAIHDTAAPVSAWTLQTVTGSQAYRTYTVELLSY